MEEEKQVGKNTKSSAVFNRGNYLSNLEVSTKAPNIYMYLILSFGRKQNAFPNLLGYLLQKNKILSKRDWALRKSRHE